MKVTRTTSHSAKKWSLSKEDLGKPRNLGEAEDYSNRVAIKTLKAVYRRLHPKQK